MPPKAHMNAQEPATEDGGDQNALEAQLAELRAELATLRSRLQVPPARTLRPSLVFQAACPSSRASEVKTYASGSSKWRHFAVFTATTPPMTTPRCHPSPELPWRTLASGWFLFWASRAPAEEQTWAQFTQDALTHFEASNYQTELRQKLRQLCQVDDIEDYNGKYSALIFRVKNMSEVDQVSNYCDGIKRATQAYVKLQNATTLSEAMDHAAKYEMSHFGGDHKVSREKPEREQRFRGKPRANPPQDMKPFSRRSFKPGHYARAEQSKEGRTCVLLLQEARSL
ncbi:uncharacterized protein IUM83_08325 [Phytophthora cinnamomi]|uniref:uncharacterized protein n=1 Tax=Phytophthora cinnamomi TaxID=4785 RepID=UPI0035595D3E|nr:hypothetical protein IUM83_08325 [Phytophthora cinnamomi]